MNELIVALAIGVPTVALKSGGVGGANRSGNSASLPLEREFRTIEYLDAIRQRHH